ncbi:ABC transporter ATP-binding protein [Martelella alba]|nr:ABC transporter ATP-binding protein [Martelella alba]
MPDPMSAARKGPRDAAFGSICVEKVEKIYESDRGTVRALSDIDLSIERGRFVTLFGPSGCGKSTLLRVIAGLEEQTAGAVSLFGQTPAEASRDKNIAWIPQSNALLPWLTIRDNVLLSQKINREAERRGKSLRIPEDPDQVLDELKLGDFKNARPSELSGGMRQRAAIARGFVQGAPLMLMDEPFSALDELTRDALRLRLLTVWERHRKTVVFVTHSAFEAVLLSDQVVVMTPRPGRIHSVIDIDLPRPRTFEVTETREFEQLVRAVKHTLRDGWEADE